MPLEQKTKNDQVLALDKLEHSLPRSPRKTRAYLVLRCLASVLVTLLVLEGLARFIVSVSGAYVGPSIEFDRGLRLPSNRARRTDSWSSALAVRSQSGLFIRS